MLRKAAPWWRTVTVTGRVRNSFVVEYTSARHRVRAHRRGIDAFSERWLPDLMRCRRLDYRHCRLIWRWYFNLTIYEILLGPLYTCSAQMTTQKWFLHLCFSSDCTLGLEKGCQYDDWSSRRANDHLTARNVFRYFKKRTKNSASFPLWISFPFRLLNKHSIPFRISFTLSYFTFWKFKHRHQKQQYYHRFFLIWQDKHWMCEAVLRKQLYNQ